MKRILTFLCVFILCFSTLFSTPAFADCSEADSVLVAAGGSVVSPCAEETEWVFRIHNGYYEKRLWSITYGKWLTDWIVLAPATWIYLHIWKSRWNTVLPRKCVSPWNAFVQLRSISSPDNLATVPQRKKLKTQHSILIRYNNLRKLKKSKKGDIACRLW